MTAPVRIDPTMIVSTTRCGTVVGMAGAFAPAGAVSVHPTPSSVRVARRFVADRLRASGLGRDLVDTAVLLASEVVTNAVLHAHTEVEVRVGVGAGARIEVVDGSALHPARREHEADSVSGRGLELVEAMASSFGVDVGPGDGKTVWFTVGPTDAAAYHDWQEAEPTVDTSAPVVARLVNLPVDLYEVMRDHNEALLREYTVWRLERPDEAGVDLAEVSAADRTRRRVVEDVLAGLDAAGTPGGVRPTHLHVDVTVSGADLISFRVLQTVLEAAERQAAAGVVLTRPALPEVAALRTWLLSQLVGQLAGAPARPWRYTDVTQPGQLLPLVELDLTWLATLDQPVIVGDDGNRILGASPPVAALLGWRSDELRGQRLITIIPPRLREAHVTGFTRLLVTGAARMIGRPVEVPAWHRDGHEVPVTLTLERRQVGDRIAFVAWLSTG